MIESGSRYVLTINTGSSSLKAGLYPTLEPRSAAFSMNVMRIGARDGLIQITDAEGNVVHESRETLHDHAAAFKAVFSWLGQQQVDQQLEAVGHRIVHGGVNYTTPQWLSSALVKTLHELAPLDPDHLPQAIRGIEAVQDAYPALPQAACFDTAFHRRMPKRAQMYALPRHFYDDGIMHFGFHGLSYEYIVDELRRLEPEHADGRVIVAHLGGGASIAAILGGRSMDTSMGFTPTSGLIMGTRCGDIDPGILLYLIKNKGTPQALDTLLNQQSGLLGLSQISADMHDLLEQEFEDTRAAEAIECFCYQAKKYLGAYVGVLGGLDVLVFTGGIGEHAAAVRQRICTGLEPLGIKLDAGRNCAGEPVISDDTHRAIVRVIAADENQMIARHVAALSV